jgi:hypothetical protein
MISTTNTTLACILPQTAQYKYNTITTPIIQLILSYLVLTAKQSMNVILEHTTTKNTPHTIAFNCKELHTNAFYSKQQLHNTTTTAPATATKNWEQLLNIHLHACMLLHATAYSYLPIHLPATSPSC